MNKITNNRIPDQFKFILPAFLSGGMVTIYLYLQFFQQFILARRILAAILLSSAVLGALFLVIFNRYLLWRYKRLPQKHFWFLVGVCLFFGFGLAMKYFPTLPINYLLVPQHELTITALGKKSPEAANSKVKLERFYNGFQEVSFLTFTLNGDWTKEGKQLVAYGEQTKSILWKGSAAGETKLVFQSSPEGGKVAVAWDGQEEVIDLFSKEQQIHILKTNIDVPIINKVPQFLIEGFLLSLLLLNLSLIALDITGGLNSEILSTDAS